MQGGEAANLYFRRSVVPSSLDSCYLLLCLGKHSGPLVDQMCMGLKEKEKIYEGGREDHVTATVVILHLQVFFSVLSFP